MILGRALTHENVQARVDPSAKCHRSRNGPMVGPKTIDAPTTRRAKKCSAESIDEFRDVGKQRGDYFQTLRSGRGAAVWDYDNDGDLDIIVSHVDLQATSALLRNDGGNCNHWLGLQLLPSKDPAAAIGAKVAVTTGALRQLRVNQWSTSYLSSNDPRIHFGLGKKTKVDKLEIHWLDGQVQVFEDLAVDRYITIRQGSGIESLN